MGAAALPPDADVIAQFANGPYSCRIIMKEGNLYITDLVLDGASKPAALMALLHMVEKWVLLRGEPVYVYVTENQEMEKFLNQRKNRVSRLAAIYTVNP